MFFFLFFPLVNPVWRNLLGVFVSSGGSNRSNSANPRSTRFFRASQSHYAFRGLSTREVFLDPAPWPRDPRAGDGESCGLVEMALYRWLTWLATRLTGLIIFI